MPLGPRANQAGAPEVEGPVRPDDFWGEGSAAIHDVLRAPEVAEDGESGPISVRRPGAWRRREAVGRRLVGVVSTRARGHVSAARLPQVRLVRLLAGGLALLVCSAALVGRLEGAGPGTALRASARATVAAGAALRAGAPDPRDSTWRRAALFLALRRTPSLKGASGSRRRHVTRPQSAGAVSSESGTGVSPAPTYVSAPVSPSSAPVAQAATAPSSGSSSDGSSSGGVSASAGPQGPGAPFGPGHLG